MNWRTFLILLIACGVNIAQSQTVKGSWYGRADVVVRGNASNYLTELQLKQKGTDIEGIFGYYFKDTYQSFFIRGTYDPQTRQVNIDNLPLTFYASNTRNGIECPMRFQGTLMVSKVKSTLRGMFYADPKYQYTCPQLTVNMTLDQNDTSLDSALRNTIAGKKFWAPNREDVEVASYASANSAASRDSIDNRELSAEFASRKSIYEKDIVVYDDSILVSFYDNGDIDDDTISVFLNKKPILVKRGLSSRALNIYIGLDSGVAVNELSMFADNLGKYPPNTALMVISDRQRRYELYLSASLKQNASIRLRRP